MDQAKTFPCPGCGAPLIVGSGDPMPDVRFLAPLDQALDDQIAEISPDPQDFRTEAAFLAAEKAHAAGVRRPRRSWHYPFGSDCNMRALVAAVRSLDAGQRDRAQIATESDQKRDRIMDALAADFSRYMENLSPPLPTADDLRDRAGCPYCGTTDHLEGSPASDRCRERALRGDPDHPGLDNPLIGNRCTHGVRLDEPCAKCDAATTHCPPPCGARHDQPATAHAPNCPRGPMSAIPDAATSCTHGPALAFCPECPPDTHPVYGPCGVCKGDHVTEDHEAAPGVSE